MISAFFRLLHEARDRSPLRSSAIHGEKHWRAVAQTGLVIAEADACISPRIVVAFGIVHDCRRFDEHADPQHGDRASEFLRTSDAAKEIFNEVEIDSLAYACRHHEHGYVERSQQTIGCCWDADRFNLPRVGVLPHPDYFSTNVALTRFDEIHREAQSIIYNPPKWDAILEMLAQLEARRAFTSVPRRSD